MVYTVIITCYSRNIDTTAIICRCTHAGKLYKTVM